MAKSLDREVRARAKYRCEYCLMAQAFYRSPSQLDHIISRQHGGETTLGNLALSCMHCNSHKGPNIAGLDTLTNQVVPLFHPRRDTWTEHFIWAGARLVGRTAVGRATIAVLAINHPEYVAVRESLMVEGVFPPRD